MDKYVEQFNNRVGNGYDLNRANSILKCFQENKMEYYPTGYNKYDWLFIILCKEYRNLGKANYPSIEIPNIIFSPSFYGFVILDIYKATCYDDLFQAIKYKLDLNSLQVKYLSRCSSLQLLIEELVKYSDRYSGNTHIFNSLRCKKRDDLELVEVGLKSMKL